MFSERVFVWTGFVRRQTRTDNAFLRSAYGVGGGVDCNAGTGVGVSMLRMVQCYVVCGRSVIMVVVINLVGVLSQ